MSIFYAQEWVGGLPAGHAHSFRGTCSFFAARSGHIGDMSRLRRVSRACPASSDAGRANRGTCSFFAGAQKANPGTCSLFAARRGHMGDMSRPWFVGRACPVDSEADPANSERTGSRDASWGDMLILRRGERLAGGPRDMPILYRGQRRGGTSPGDMPILAAGHAHFSGQGVDIWGICPRLGSWGGHVPWGSRRRALTPARGHRRPFPLLEMAFSDPALG